jgi:diguanylate cyclase (GGDEF)-like protein
MQTANFRFTQVNVSIRHGAGDALLGEVARRLLSRVRESHTLSRLGGDEFQVIWAVE